MLVDRLAGYGFDRPAEEIFTATLAGAALLRANGYRRVAPFLPAGRAGGHGGARAPRGHLGPGARRRPTPSCWATWASAGPSRCCRRRSSSSWAVAALVALSRDRYFRQGERLALDAGPFVAALEYAADATAAVAGKPSPAFFQAAASEPRPRRRPRGRDGGRRPLVRRRGCPARGAAGLAGPHREVPRRGAPSGRNHRPTGSLPASPNWAEGSGIFRALVTGARLRFRRLLPVLILLLPLGLAAQTPADSAQADSARAALRPAGDTLRAVALDRRDIFDPDERGWVARVANALHIQTRAATIRRELLFKPGEPYDSARDRRIGAQPPRARRLPPGPHRHGAHRLGPGGAGRSPRTAGAPQADWRFRSTGGEVAFTIGLVENNLLGTASSAAVRYKKTPDRSTVTLAFRRPRLFAGSGRAQRWSTRIARTAGWSGLSLEQPFYSLTSRRGFRLEGEDRDERVLRFFDGARTARDTLTHRYSLGARVRGLGAPGFLRGLSAARRPGTGTPRRLPAGTIYRAVSRRP